MSGEPEVTIVGNLTADPELRFTPSGAAVANFTIASTPRYFDKGANEWKDGETMFVRSTVWREYAENVAESLTKGARVVAQGRLKSRSYETREGDKRTNWELDVDEIGPSLRYATAKVTKAARNGNGGGGFGGGQQGGQQDGSAGWGTAPGGQQGAPYGGGGQQGAPYGGQNGGPGPYGGGGQHGGPPAGGGGQGPLTEDPWATGGDVSGNDGPPF